MNNRTRGVVYTLACADSALSYFLWSGLWFVKDFVLPVNLTAYSALNSDHFPVTDDLRGRSSLQALPDRPSLKRVDWIHLQDHLSDRLYGNPRVDSVEDIDARLEELTNAIQHQRTNIPSSR